MHHFSFYNKQAIVRSNGHICGNPAELVETKVFKSVVKRYLKFLKEKNSPLLAVFHKNHKKMTEEQEEEIILKLLNLLTKCPKDIIIKNNPEFKDFFKDIYLLNQFVEQLYNYWRNFERFFVFYSDKKLSNLKHPMPHREFNAMMDHLNNVVREAYRDICENITGTYPRVYRQVSSAFQVGLIAVKENIKYPHPYSKLAEIPFIKQVLITPPLVIDPPVNKRKGQFEKINSNPLKDIDINPDEWLCYPAKVGQLIIHVFFHNKFIALGTALANLFELAKGKDMKRKPDGIYVYGICERALAKCGAMPTVFYDDKKNKIIVGAVSERDEFGYFGYLKKMILTLHNTIVMKQKHLPIHGAMVSVNMKNGRMANIVIVGDTGTGKSESIEAFRVLADKYMRDMAIVFDDMGSLRIEKGKIKAYGTETGAFVRLDDLQPGFAFGNIDRSIIMSPQKTNARAVLPISTYEEIVEGHNVDFILYANNYEHVDNIHPFYEEFKTPNEAIEVFRQGARMAKGTTAEEGLVHSYFANIFGPAQNKKLYDGLAKKYFHLFFAEGIKVGQIRTRLGIPGFETEGPESAAKALFEVISKS